jgi:hypothetical protein
MVHRLAAAMRGNLVAWLALFVALGGTSMAASHFVVTSTKQIDPRVIKKLRGNRGPAGPQGPQGAQGQTGLQGPAGIVDTTNFFNKTESDGRYLGKGAQATDSAALGGVAAAGYTTGEGSQGGRWQELANKGKETEFLAVPGIGELATECITEPTKATSVQLTENPGATEFLTWGSIPEKQTTRMETDVLKSGNTSLAQAFAPAENGTGQMIIQVTSGLETPEHIFATITVSASVTEGFCRFQANYTVARQHF